ncbi:uncharacterized protein QC761_0024590 [Podospora bellae-mahoneyi]|uniref:Uncharacterized protein n=1 Tax=Podospora bellae-mahoneyi TaxID=2093777 RepID=A0ABR0FUH1_9PEZI|nr:hypothetical protein QC761_0024590 [Podospora bellae-mahoneyi]
MGRSCGLCCRARGRLEVVGIYYKEVYEVIKSEIKYISKKQLLVLPRDSDISTYINSPTSVYRYMDVVNIGRATDIRGSKERTSSVAHNQSAKRKIGESGARSRFVNNGKIPYKDASGCSLDQQALVFRVTLPKKSKPLIG